MKIQIEIAREQLDKAINSKIAQLKREQNKPGQNDLIKKILQDEINQFAGALAGAKEVK